MNKSLLATFVCTAGLLCTAAWSAPGEYWEITSKMEMPGMPMAMPATTIKVCIAKGAEKNPPPNKDCETTDVRTSGSKTLWKVRCNQNGEIMTGSGEMSGNADKSEGTTRLTGKSGGQNIDMTMTYQSRRIGGACDSDEMMNKVKSQMCDTSKFTSTVEWIGSAERFLKDQTACPGKKEPLCNAVRKDAVRDGGIYQMLVTEEKRNGGLIARSCGLDMEATTRTMCKSLTGSKVEAMASYCPAEAKAYRDAARKKACEGRSYTSKGDLAKCLSGTSTAATDDEAPAASTRSTSKGTSKGNAAAPDESQTQSGQGKSSSAAPAPAPTPASPNPADAVLDGAKKLKGLFGL